MDLPPDIVGGEEWDLEDVQLQDWLEEKAKKQRELLRTYGYGYRN